METLVNENKMETIRDMLGYEGCYVVNNVGHSGGLAILWKEKNTASVVGHTRNYIDMEVVIEGQGHWRLTGYYGYPENRRRRESWAMLKMLSYSSPLPWCCIGDFNDLLELSEKKRKTVSPSVDDLRISNHSRR